MSATEAPADAAPAEPYVRRSIQEPRTEQAAPSSAAGGRPVTPPPATSRPSLGDRIAASVATAVGTSWKSSASAPEQPNASAPPQTGRDRTAAPETREAQTVDADTDTVPPRLLGAVFEPQEIGDGEATVLTLTVTDDLAGIRSVSGIIASPTGSIQGFSSHREGESDRYVARITVPRQAPAGIWYVRQLTLTDRANNSASLSYSHGALPPSASFRVTSADSDTTAPVLRDVWVARPAIRGLEKTTIFVQAEDAGSGLAAVSGVFRSPRKQARLGFGCRPGSQEAWECGLTPPRCLDCGIWQLEQIQLQDKAGNLATFRADDPIVSRVHLDIAAEACDSAPPVLVSLSVMSPVVSSSEGGSVRLEALVTDDACGVAGLSGQAAPVGPVAGQRAHFAFEPTSDPQRYIANIPIPKHAAKGTWQITWLQAVDRGQNLRTYGTSEPVISRATFRVE